MKQNDTNKKIIVIIILVVIILIVFGIIMYKLIRDKKKEDESSPISPTSPTSQSEEYKGYGKELIKACENNNCQDIDPVDNIKNVVKQTILLEEHLIEKNNACHECIITHFLHCIALLEEAVKISHKNVRKYPRLQEAFELYKELFEEWSKNKQKPDVVQNISEKLLNMKKKLMEQYYIL